MSEEGSAEYRQSKGEAIDTRDKVFILFGHTAAETLQYDGRLKKAGQPGFSDYHMKAQEARKFETHGGITIEKPFKHEPPYIEGASLEQTDGGSWRLVDGTGRPIEGEDGAENVFVPPVQSGDVVYIREPWIRLKNPDGSPSDRIRLAADSVVSEGQQAHKWSSPE